MFLLLLLLCHAQKSKVDTAGTKDIEGVVVTALGIKREKVFGILSQVGCDIQKISRESISFKGFQERVKAGLSIKSSGI